MANEGGRPIMSTYWEERFRLWGKSPSKSEQDRCENAESAVRNAIERSPKVGSRNIQVFSQGSYRNRTNVRRDSDVDIGVLCYDTFFPEYPAETSHETFGNTAASYHYDQFKNEVGEALVAYFGVAAVTRGNKAFDVKATTYHVEADVAPFFEHRRYSTTSRHLSGVELRPDNGPPWQVINWPEQHYENGNQKNTRTRRRYRAMVRVLKSLRNEMGDSGISDVDPIIGFLCECLIWNIPDPYFNRESYYETLQDVLAFLYQNTKQDATCKEWGEVSELKYLFNVHQKWTRAQVNSFLLAAWRHVGFQ